MTFKDIPLEISYKSVGEDSFSEILNPLLACTKIYKRSVGFFSSSADKNLSFSATKSFLMCYNNKDRNR